MQVVCVHHRFEDQHPCVDLEAGPTRVEQTSAPGTQDSAEHPTCQALSERNPAVSCAAPHLP